MASAYGALVNGGRRVHPRIVVNPSKDAERGNAGRELPGEQILHTSVGSVGVNPVLSSWASDQTEPGVPRLIFLRTERVRRFDRQGLTSLVVLAAVHRGREARVLAMHVESPRNDRSLRSIVRAAGTEMLADVPSESSRQVR